MDWCLLAEIDEEEVMGPLLESQNNTFIIMILSVILLIIVGFFLSKRISKPIERLTLITTEISKGDFNVAIDEDLKSAKSEIGDLTRAFDRVMVSMKLAIKKIEEKRKNQD